MQDRILVRAGFHPTIENIEHEIIIDPKMSFGTGHHATTALMLETILDMKPDFSGKKVLDMGCGTWYSIYHGRTSRSPIGYRHRH